MKKIYRILLALIVLAAAAFGTSLYLKAGIDGYTKVQLESLVLYSASFMADQIFFVFAGVLLLLYGAFQIGNSNAWFSSLILPTVTIMNFVASLGYLVYQVIFYVLNTTAQAKTQTIGVIIFTACSAVTMIFALMNRMNGLTLKIFTGIMAVSAIAFSTGKAIFAAALFLCFMFYPLITYTDRENGRNDSYKKPEI